MANENVKKQDPTQRFHSELSQSSPARQLEVMIKLSSLLNSSLDANVIRQRAIKAASLIVDCEASSLLLVNEATGGLYFDVALGGSGDAVKSIQLRKGQGIAGWVAEHQEPLLITDAQKDPRLFRQADEKSGFTTRNMLCVPLTVKSSTVGVLQALNKRKSGFSKDDVNVLFALGNQIAVALDNARLYDETRESLHSVVYVLADAIERRDAQAGGHSKRVAKYAVAIGAQLGLSRHELVNLKLAAYLHDIGMISTPDNLMNKRAVLDEEEKRRLMDHVFVGEEMISGVKRLNHLMPAVKYHHEHYDGTGFFGLRGEKIPLMARVVAVADAFDAMTSTRPYITRRGYVSAMKELQDKSGSHYDPKVVEAFFKSHVSRLAIRH